jgi:hypothetical protein
LATFLDGGNCAVCHCQESERINGVLTLVGGRRDRS